MNEYEEFMKKRNPFKIGKTYFDATKETIELANKITIKPFSVGIPLGYEKKEFIPSLHLLEIIDSQRKVFINPKSEWLFLCQRDVFEKSISKLDVKKGEVLVYNEIGENLGYGELKIQKNGLLLKNKLDRGDFLRREK